MPIDLDGCGRLTIRANVEQEMMGWSGYNPVPKMGVSWYNLDIETSRKLYDLKRFSKAFSEELSNEFEQFVAGIIMDVLVEIDRAHGDRNRLAERRDEIMNKMRECGCKKEILLEKYSKFRRDRKYKAKVYRSIGHGIGDAIRVDLVNCKTDDIVVSEWLDELPHTVDMAGAVTRTGWNGSLFKMKFFPADWGEKVRKPAKKKKET